MAEAPVLPSSWYGTITISGAPAPEGTEVSAWFAGVEVAAATSFLEAGEGRYRLDVPGDDAATPAVEGPPAGQPFELRVASRAAATVSFAAGAYSRRDLQTTAGADLRLAISDGVASVAAGAMVTLSITAVNDGPGTATGSVIAFTLPAGFVASAISHGGTAVGGFVRWPVIDLEEGAAATRTLQLQIAPSFAAGVATIALEARVDHDGSNGPDPDLADNTAVDVDTLVAAPELGVAISDGTASARPGDTLFYRVAVANSGSQGATGVTLQVDLPSSLEFYSASHGGAFTAGRVSWPIFGAAVGAANERTVTVRVPTTLADGVATIVAVAAVHDDGANGDDANGANDTATDMDSVERLPDLQVDGFSDAAAVTDLQTLALSGEVSVSYANRGALDSAPSEIVLFLDRDRDQVFDTGEPELGRLAVGGLGVAATASASIPVSGTLDFRDEPISAFVDAGRVVAETDETNNVADGAARCEPAVVPGAFQPAVEMHWPPAGGPSRFPRAVDSLSTPIVVQLTDDNGDGKWDERDVPDIVFVAADLVYTLEPEIALRAIRGDTGASIFDINGFFPGPLGSTTLFSLSGLAAGDIDNDGKPEIVTTLYGGDNVVQVYEHNGAFKWRSPSYRTHPTAGVTTSRDNPTIADLDGDGFAEIVVGANVFDRSGQLKWRGTGGQGFQAANNLGDFRSGAISAAADIDLDGRLEVVTGNTLYRHDGSIVWRVPYADGYPAVANFDADPNPEIVVVSRGTVRLHDANGALLWGPVTLPGSDPEAGGPPVVGDFDGDGAPEVGVAGSDVYVVLETNGAQRWQASTRDYTSNTTGSTLFDFDGDGSMEVVYRDEQKLRIYRGSDGVVLYELAMSSDTWTEQPIVADVDRDGNAEIVVSSDRALDVPAAGPRTNGLFVLGDPLDRWVAARPIWNQHAYTPELVGTNAAIPRTPAWSWLAHNSFRANVAPAGGSFASPDLTASRLSIDLSALPKLRVGARIGNAGRAGIASGLRVAFYAGDAGGTLLGTATLTQTLLPGEYADVAGEFDLPLGTAGRVTVVADDDGTSDGRERECDEANNLVTLDYDGTALGLWLTLDDATTSVGAGDEVTYTIRVANSFAGVATGVALVDSLPAELQFLSASDGGALAGGRVEWPLFTLAPGTIAVRTLTARVDPDLPIGTLAVTNSATVGDDGSQGADPTPANNTATDVDAVVTATASAGGPYAASEGDTVLLDGSASFDRDGALVAYDWDLDGDGDFDDATGEQVAWLFADDGVLPIRLRVRDDAGETDVASTTATIANVVPVVSGPPAVAAEEGAVTRLVGFAVADPGSDALTAVVDWGDGTSEPATISGGGLSAEHVYAEDGVRSASVCVADGDGGESCLPIAIEVQNVAPEVHETTAFSVEGWTAEELPGASTVRWSLDGAGATASELANGRPSFLVGNLPSFGTYEFSLRVATSADDDLIGFGLGYHPGDLARDSAEYLLVDWKQADQSGSKRGLALSRVYGSPAEAEFWLHTDQDANGSAKRVQEIARARTLGSRGWSDFTTYLFRVESLPTRLRVWVNGSLEFDLAGTYPSGFLAFYNYSQAYARYTPISTQLFVSGLEGSPASLRAGFADPGTLDVHTASVDWGDGEISVAAVSEEEGSGEAIADHVYADDGSPSVRLCVLDDEGAEGCATIPSQIENVAPVVNLQVASTGFVENAVSLAGTTFADPGVLDVHAATVDWGDGTIEAATVVEANGSGSVTASHLYAAPGSYPLRLCVDDGDGGTTCAERAVVLVYRVLDLEVTKTAPVKTIRPNQQIVFTLLVRNKGSLPAAGVVVSDVVPANLLFVSATGGGALSAGTVTWNIASLAAGAQTSVTVTMKGAATLPFGGSTVNTAIVVDNGASGIDGDLSNNSSSWTVKFGDLVTPIVATPETITGIEGTALTYSGASYTDTASTESHTATISWGDGATTAVGLSPATGVAGTVSKSSHTYLDNGTFIVEVCVRDAADHIGCSTTTATVANAPPVVIEPGAINFHSWRSETYPGSNASNWQVTGVDGVTVTELNNSDPSFYYSPASAAGVIAEGFMGAFTTGDDDFFGIAVGFSPGETADPAADYLLVDWKQGNQNLGVTGCGTAVGRRGLALSRVIGIPHGGELWGHANFACNGAQNGVIELARGATLGSVGWVDNREYKVKVQYELDRVLVWVNDVLQIDVAGVFPTGPMAFYEHSQPNTRFRGFIQGLASQAEGETFELASGFTDLGRVDTFGATIAWDDNAVTDGVVLANGGVGSASASHDYFDNGTYSIEMCVTDDDGGSDCGRFPLLVTNVAPTVVASADTTTSAGLERAYELGTFTDPGRLDSHAATVDWGDGVIEDAMVVSDDGSGTVSGTHAYATAGTKTVRVCVTDDDGGEGCDTLLVTVGVELPVLTATKTVSAIDRDGDGQVTPGDDLSYEIEIRNVGGSAANAIVLTDPTPAHTTLQPTSVTPELLVTSLEPLTVGIPKLDPGFALTVRFVASIDGVLPADVTEIVNSGTVTSAEFGPIATDDPALPGAADPTRIGVATRVTFALTKSATPIDLDGNGVLTEGDEVAWSIVATNVGDTEAAGVLLRDPLPLPGELVAESVVASTGIVTRLDPLELIVDRVGAGESATLSFRTKLPIPIERTVAAVVNQAELVAGDEAPVRSDDPATPALQDPTALPILPIPTLSASSPGVPEGDAGTTTLRFRLALDVPTSFPVSAAWTTADGGATAGADYLPAAGVASFAPGEVESFVDVTIAGDPIVEADESVRLLLSAPHWLHLAASEAVGTIVNDDAAELSIADAGAVEGDPLAFVVRLSRPSAFAVAIDWSTSDGSALAGEDFVSGAERLVFAPLELEREIVVATVEDETTEDDETMQVALADASGATIAGASGIGTILDDDAPVLVVTKSVGLERDVDGDGAVDRGELVRFRIRVENTGRGKGREVRLVDALPAGLALIGGSVSSSAGTVVSERPIEIDFGTIEPQAVVEVELVAFVDPAVGPFAVELPNQALVRAAGGFEFPSDDPATPERLDATVVALPGIPRLAASKVAALALDADGDGQPSPGDELLYTVVVVNSGGAVANGVHLRDFAPASTSIVAGSVSTDRGTIVGESPVEVALGALGAGETATIRFRVVVAPVVPSGFDAVSNQGLVTSEELPAVPTDDPALGGDADPTVTTIVAAPRLVVEKSDTLAVDAGGDGVASPGDTIDYRITVRNRGNTSATGLVVEDPAPADAAIEPGSATTSVGVVVSVDPLRVEIEELRGGESAELHLRARIDGPIAAGVRQIANQAAVTSVELPLVASDDPDVGGTSDPTVTPVVAAPALLVEKRDYLFEDGAGDGVASPGDLLLYRIVLRNQGNAVATEVALDDALDPALTIEPGSAQSSQGAVESKAPLRVALGALAADGTVEISFRARIAAPFPLDRLAVANQAVVSSAEAAPVVSDDPETDAPGDPTSTEVFIAPGVSVSDVGAPEVAGSLPFLVSLSEPSNRAVELTFATADGTATAPADYGALSADISIPAGAIAASIPVPVVDDALYEGAEQMAFVVGAASGATIVDGLGLGTIVDDDPAPALAIGDAAIAEGDAGMVDLYFPVTLSAASGLPARAKYSTAPITAAADVDYLSFTGLITVPAGATESSVRIEVVGDLSDEIDERFAVSLADPVDVTLADETAVGTILDDDLAQLSIGDVTVTEGDTSTTPATFRISLAEPAAEPVSFDFTSIQDTATESLDYSPIAGSTTIPAGGSSTSLTVDVVGDTWFEEDERFLVRLANPVAAELVDAEGAGTIRNDEGCASANLVVNGGAETLLPDGQIADWTPVVGAWLPRFGSPSAVVEKAYFDGAPEPLAELAQPVSLALFSKALLAGDGNLLVTAWVRQDGNGAPAAVLVDLYDAAGALVDSVPVGAASASTAWEPLELEVSAPAGTASAVVRLLGGGYFDGVSLRVMGAPTLSISDASVQEPANGTAPLPFVVSLSCPIEPTLRISVATANGSATAGADYLPKSEQVTIPRGEVTGLVPVSVLADLVAEGPERLFLDAAGVPSVPWVVLVDARGVGAIADDDFCQGTVGYWKSHPEQWPFSATRIGAVLADKVTLDRYLADTSGDLTLRLAQQLTATKLNLARGSEPSIAPIVQASDAFLTTYPPEGELSEPARIEADRLKTLLDKYNNGCRKR